MHITDIWILNPTAERLRRIPLGRLQASLIAHGKGLLDSEAVLDKVFADLEQSVIAAKRTRRKRLKRPSQRRLPDEFFADVATTYRDAVRNGLQPRKALADDTGAADATVAGWIVEARKRGHLPPAHPGKVSP